MLCNICYNRNWEKDTYGWRRPHQKHKLLGGGELTSYPPPHFIDGGDCVNHVTYAELFQLLQLLAEYGTFLVALIALVIQIVQIKRKKK